MRCFLDVSDHSASDGPKEIDFFFQKCSFFFEIFTYRYRGNENFENYFFTYVNPNMCLKHFLDLDFAPQGSTTPSKKFSPSAKKKSEIFVLRKKKLT